MAYKFQIGAARLSGSIIQTDGDGDLRATTVDSLSSGVVEASGLSSLDGGINVNDDFTVDVDGNVVAVAGTYSGLASLDGGINTNDDFTVDTDGNVVAVAGTYSGLASLDGGINTNDDFTVDTDGNVVAVAGTFSGLASLDGGINVNDDFTVDANGAVVAVGISAGGAITNATTVSGSGAFSALSLNLKSVAVTSTAAELNLVDAITQGSIIKGDSGNSSALLAKGAEHSFLQAGASDISYVAMSGDATLAAGVISIGNTRVTDAMMNDDVATGLAGAGSTATSGIINVIGGDGITANANDIEVTPAQTTITSVLNAALVVGRDAQNKVDFATDNFVKIYSNGAERLVISDTGNTIVKGNLLVEGTTTTIDSTTINVSRSLTFEGPASDFECTFGYGATDAPLQDITVILPEYSSSAGGHNVKAAVISKSGTSAQFLAASLVTAAEFSLLDGATTAAGSITIIDADRMILNDDGTMKQVLMSDVKTYAEEAANALTVAVVADSATLSIDVVSYVADRDGAGQNVGVTLPASNDNLIGKSIYIKAGNLENSAKVTVETAALGQKIDGANEIILESPYASVRLIYVVADQWRVF